MLYKTEAIILKSNNLGEIDRLITAYSKDLGKILIKAKSVRKNQAKLKGHLEPFTLSYLMIAPAKGFNIITGAETVNNFSELKKDLTKLAFSCYIADLVNNLIAGPEKDTRIWQLLTYTFEELDKKSEDFFQIIKDFESRIIVFLGYGEDHKDVGFFIDSLIGKRLPSKIFLQNVVRMVK